ncbi:MAG: hypothetical protein ACKVPX_00090 [Myxococcaceae bacterium]
MLRGLVRGVGRFAGLLTLLLAGCDGLFGPGGGGDGGGDADGGVGVDPSCLQRNLTDALGKTRLLVGAQLDASLASTAQIDIRYLYLAGGVFDSPQPCTSCTASCSAGGTTCAGAGCGWWGCWQDVSVAPGQYLRNFLNATQTRSQVPWVTYYEILQASGGQDGPELVDEVTSVSLMTRYFNDFRFVLQQIGTRRAFFHVEPDFWGYAQYANTDPHALPAAVASANSQDCSSQANTVAGMGRCLISMVRKYAPNALVGLHASAWSTRISVLGNRSASLDVAGEAVKTANFLREVGATRGDFIVVEASDRDAGYYTSIGRDTWWDATNVSLPSFTQALTWVRTLSDALVLPNIFWQLPLGNMSLPNTNQRWQDNRVDYFFANPSQLVGARTAGMLFGAGQSQQTTPGTDNGNMLAKAAAYVQSGGTPVCP